MTETFDIPPRDKAAEGILWLIQSEGLAGGDRLPAERVLCERLGVSRTALRGAIAQLTSAHVLESRVGSGTYVCPVKPISIFQSAGAFSEAVRNAGLTPTAQVLSQGCLPAGADLAAKMGVPEGSIVFELRRLRMADGVPVAIETTYVNRGVCVGIEERDFATESLYRVLEQEYGILIKRSVERISITRVNEAESQILKVPEGEPAFYERGIEWTEEREPVEYFKSVTLPAHFRFAGDEAWIAGAQEVSDVWLRS